MLTVDRSRFSLYVLVLSAVSASSAYGGVPTGGRARQLDGVDGYVSTRIIVRFAPAVVEASDEKASARYKVDAAADRATYHEVPPDWAGVALSDAWRNWNVVGMRRMCAHAFSNPGAAAHHGLDRTFVLDVPAGTDTAAMAAAFAALGDQVESVELDAIGTVAEFIPNDAEFYMQYGMHNTGQTGGVVDADIDAPEAWQFHTGDVGTVTVAVVDTGVTPHAELEGRLVAGKNTTMWAYEGTVDGCPHGTHVAGIIAAAGNNAAGVAGVTWGAYIMPVRVFRYCSGSAADTAEGITWAVDNGADVINISLQFCYNDPPYFPDPPPAYFQNAIDYAHDNGVLVVGAAGNGTLDNEFCSGQVTWPAHFANCMAVSGTTDDDELATLSNTGLAWSSNYGDEVDVSAPGDRIWSTWPTGYWQMSGTSMAAPHVTGLAALLKSYVPSLTGDEIWAVISETADDLGPEGWDEQYGHGRINAYQALLAAGPTRIIASSPPDGAIDARQPSEPDGSDPAGWQLIDLTIGGDASLVPTLAAGDFVLTQEGGVDPAPTIVEVLPIEGEERAVTAVLDRPISTRAWTTITHVISGTSVSLGYLPGDVNADYTSAPSDILRVIDALNGVINLPIWSTDIDRSGTAAPPDILREIDLLNGAGEYEPFLGVTLP